ncbi:MAG: hypothetical protein P8Y53_17895, partial [Pseudolabrys sp.]
MAKSPGKPSKRKNPAKAPRSKAARPDAPPTPDELADLLNPGIGRGTAGLGSGTGLTPPPDNSWDRRQDFSAAHTARKSAKTKGGFGEAAQRNYEAPPVLGIDPQLARELGLDADEAEFPSPLWGGARGGGPTEGQSDTAMTPLTNPPPHGGREQAESAARAETG